MISITKFNDRFIDHINIYRLKIINYYGLSFIYNNIKNQQSMDNLNFFSHSTYYVYLFQNFS